MAAKKRKGLVKIVLEWLMVIPTLFGFVDHVTALFSYELHQAKRNLVFIFFLCMLLWVFIVSLWLSICACILVYLLSLKLTWMISLMIIALLNTLILTIICLLLLLKKRELSFPETAQLIRDACRLRLK